MTAPGRNDPCSCGSGKKFKRCCGIHSCAPAEITDTDRALAYDLLERLARSRRFADDFAIAAELLHDEASDVPSPLDFEDDVAIGRVLDWFCFDVPLQRGGTIADEALRVHAGELSPGARRLITELRDAPLRLLQVRTLFFGGAALLCADVLEPPVTYRIDNPWVAVARHDLLIARLVKRGELFEIEGDPAVLPPAGKRQFARDLRRMRRKAEGLHAPAAVVRMVLSAGLLRLTAILKAMLDGELHSGQAGVGVVCRPRSAGAPCEIRERARPRSASDRRIVKRLLHVARPGRRAALSSRLRADRWRDRARRHLLAPAGGTRAGAVARDRRRLCHVRSH